jgi:hypothetical protein
MLLDFAIKLDPKNSKQKNMLSLISQSLKKLQIKTTKPDDFSLLNKAKELIADQITIPNLSSTNKIKKRNFSCYSKVTIADFEFIKSVSSGTYAKVYLAKKKTTGNMYAIKVIPKSDLKQKKTS